MLGSVPFTFVLVGVAWCWIKALREEPREARPVEPVARPRTGATVIPSGKDGA